MDQITKKWIDKMGFDIRELTYFIENRNLQIRKVKEVQKHGIR